MTAWSYRTVCGAEMAVIPDVDGDFLQVLDDLLLEVGLPETLGWLSGEPVGFVGIVIMTCMQPEYKCRLGFVVSYP